MAPAVPDSEFATPIHAIVLACRMLISLTKTDTVQPGCART